MTCVSAVSARCSSPTRWRRSPTSGARCAPARAWRCGRKAPEHNERYTEIDQAIGGASARGARMFSLADQHTTAGILAAAGFADVAFTDVREPVYYGADSAQAYDFVTGLQATKDMLASLDPAAAEDALRGLRERSPGTRPATACCSGRAPGSSPREHRAGGDGRVRYAVLGEGQEGRAQRGRAGREVPMGRERRSAPARRDRYPRHLGMPSSGQMAPGAVQALGVARTQRRRVTAVLWRWVAESARRRR